MSGRRGEEELSASARRLVRSLSVAVLLEWAGAGVILPLLPLWVRSRGGSDTVVGAVMAAYFAAAFVFQYGSGRLSDRLGRLPVLVAGLAVYAVSSLLFLVPVPPAVDTVFRALQGAGSGASVVASLAMVAHAVPLSHRGRASGRLYGAELGGLAVGPVLGSLVGVAQMRWLFVAGAIAAVFALVWVLVTASGAPVVEGAAAVPALRPAAPTGAGAPGREGPATTGRRAAGRMERLEDPEQASSPPGPPRTSWRTAVPERALLGALLAAAVIGISTGVYETCWSLLLIRHGANEWEIGMSWTLFAVPFVAMSRPAGWLADHFDRRWLGVGSLFWSLAFLVSYPFLPGFVLLLVLSVFESFGFAMTLPACQSLLGGATAPERHGRVQGLFAASQTGATAVAAAAAGALFGIGAWVPFVIAAGAGALLAIAAAGIWRRVPGRVAVTLRPPSGPGPDGVMGVVTGGDGAASATTV